MMASARALPMPGRASSSFADAELMSTGLELAVLWAGDVEVADPLGAGGEVVVLPGVEVWAKLVPTTSSDRAVTAANRMRFTFGLHGGQ